MEQLLAHLVGDYLLQSKWVAIEKLKHLWVALLHGLLYSLPFLLITTNPQSLAVIALTHAFIDRYAVGNKVMWLTSQLSPKSHRTSKKEFDKTSNGLPDWLFFILRIGTDNTMHLLINFFAIKYLG